MSGLWTIAVLWACGAGEPELPAATEGSSMAASLRAAAGTAQAVPDESKIPDRAAAETVRADPGASTPDSPACVAAKADRDKLKARVTRAYDDRVRPAEERAYQAKIALADCLADLAGCGADAKRYKAIADRSASTERSLQSEMDSVAKREAKLFPLQAEVSAACFENRY